MRCRPLVDKYFRINAEALLLESIKNRVIEVYYQTVSKGEHWGQI